MAIEGLTDNASFIIALVQGQIRIVQASLIGSILANLLLILGMAMTIGGLQYREQFYDSLVTQMSSSLLALSSLSLLIPTAFHASFSDLGRADDATLKLSRGAAVVNIPFRLGSSSANLIDSTDRIRAIYAFPAQITCLYV